MWNKRLNKSGQQEGEELSFAKGMDKALQLLSIRDYSSATMKDKLKNAGCSEETCTEICQELLERNYLNDEQLAYRLSEVYAKEKLWGSARIRDELLHRGFSYELAKEAAEQYNDTETVEDNICTLIERRYVGKLKQGKIDSVIGALCRQGYTVRDSKVAVKKYLLSMEDYSDIED